MIIFFTFFSFTTLSDTTRIKKLKNSPVNQTQKLLKKTKIWKTQTLESRTISKTSINKIQRTKYRVCIYTLENRFEYKILLFCISQYYPANIYLLKVNNRNIDVFDAAVLVTLLLILNIFHNFL